MTEPEKYLDYLKMLRKPFIKLCRLRFLQPDGSTAFMLDNRNDGHRAGTFIAGGTITHNWQNGRRTSATVTLDNVDGDYDYNFNTVWFGQEIALDEGLVLSDGVTEFYIQQGVFLIENPVESVTPGKRTVTYNLVDKTAAIDGTLGGNLDGTYQVLVGTNIFEPIAQLLAEDKGNGYPVDRVTPVFTEYYNDKTQQLPDGTVVSMVNAPYTLTIDGTDGTIWSVAAGLAAMVNGWIGYDETGALRIDPSQDDILDSEKPIEWAFSMDEAELLGMAYTVKNSEVYNDYIVTGEAIVAGLQPGGRAQILDSRSPVDINAIGRKTLRVAQVGFFTNTQCEDYAVWQVKRSAVLQRAVEISSSQIMHIRGNDIVTIVRTDKQGNPTERHLIHGFSRPLASSGAMTISAVSVNDFPIATIIRRGIIAELPSQLGSLTYNGIVQSPTWINFNTEQMSATGELNGTNAGEYNATFLPKPGYAWWDNTAGAKTSVWRIGKQSVTPPSQAVPLTYNGSTQNVTITGFDSSIMTLSGTTSGKNAGTYQATVNLRSTTNYMWSDGTTDPITVTWTIGKKALTPPTVTGTYTYTGASQTVSFSGYSSSTMTKSGTQSATNAGNYTAKIGLADTANYMWNDQTIAEKSYAWTIAKANPAVPTLSKSSGTINANGSTTFTVTRSGTGAITATSSNTSIATATVSGTTVTVNGVGTKLGTATITIKVAADTNYNAYTGTAAKFTVKVYDIAYSVKFSAPSGSVTLQTHNSTKNWDGTLYWSNGNGTWAEWDGTTTLSANPLYLCGTSNTYLTTGASDTNAYNARWVIGGSQVSCSGSAGTLLDYVQAKSGTLTSVGNYAFAFLFYNCTTLKSAPTLPMTTVSNYCYHQMFYGCAALTSAPALPATKLAKQCYSSMFSGCTSLTSAPTLPATTLAESCYQFMFHYCSALTSPPALPATTLATNCYEAMFEGCTSLTTVPKLSATTLADYCYASMFRGCTALTRLPKLSVAALPNRCYSTMFYGCTGIKLSTSKTGSYQTAYRIPASGTGTEGTFSLSSMFSSTGGTFTGTPTINTTYYTSNTIVT